MTAVTKILLESREELPLDTFSAVFDGIPKSDERPYIEAITSDPDIRSHTVEARRLRPLAILDELLESVEEPFFTPNIYLHWHLLKTAREQDVDIILDGFLGDNVVGHGSRYLTELAAQGRWWALALALDTIARRQGSRWQMLPRLLSRFVGDPLVREPAVRAWQALQRPELPPGPASRLVDRDFMRAAGWAERARERGVFAERTARSARAEQFRDLTSGTLPAAIEIARKVGAARGVDLRFPFADRDLMEYCMAVPARQKCRQGRTRAYARESLADLLPEKIARRRGKASLHPALVEALFDRDRRPLEELLFDRIPVAEEYVNVSAVQEAYQKYQAGTTGEDLVWPLWRVAVLTAWLSRRASAPVSVTTAADRQSLVSSNTSTQPL